VIATGLKKRFMSAEAGGMEDEEEVGCWQCEHDSVSSECGTGDGNCENTKAETYDRNGEQSATGEGK
jgi:hypothetical protein